MLGLTLQQVAGMLGITYQQLYKYEKGVNRISAGRLHALARALGVDRRLLRGAGLGRAGPADRRAAADARAGGELRRAAPAAAEALLELARALAEADAGPEREEAGDDGPT